MSTPEADAAHLFMFDDRPCEVIPFSVLEKMRRAADAEATDYWQTEQGILDRFSMLAEDVRLSTFNGAVKIYGTALGVTDFTISGNLKVTSCDWCIGHVGVTYHRGMFMPDLPRHPWCPHFYDIARNQ